MLKVIFMFKLKTFCANFRHVCSLMEMINIMTQYHNLYCSITSHNKYLLSIFRFLQESDYKLLYLMTSWDHLTVITQLFQCRHRHPRPERRDI